MKLVLRTIVITVFMVAFCSLYAGPFGVNVLANPGAEDGVNNWTIVAGDDFGIISTNAYGSAPHSGSYHFITSYMVSTMSQEIDLIAAGFTADELENDVSLISVGNWIASGWGGYYFFRVELRDADHSVLDSWNIGSEEDLQVIGEGTAYFEDNHVFPVAPAGLRYIYFICGGQDNRSWGEWYGAEFDDGYVILEQTTPVELSSFTASVTAQNFVQLAWVTQSETDMLGYNVLRGDTNTPQAAVCMNADIIPAGNQSMETLYSYLDEEVVENSTYWYWLESVELNGQSKLHGPASVTVLSSGPGSPDVPGQTPVTGIVRNFPNPFNPSTSIQYSLAEEGEVSLGIYNCRGELVQTMSAYQSVGRHSYVWNGRDSAGNACASGVYFFRLRANGVEDVSRGIMLK